MGELGGGGTEQKGKRVMNMDNSVVIPRGEGRYKVMVMEKIH